MAALLISEACAKTKQLYPNSIATDKIAALFADMMGLNQFYLGNTLLIIYFIDIGSLLKI